MRCPGHFDPQDSAPTPRCEQSIRIELPASTWATCWGAFFPLYVHLGSCLVHPMPCVQDRHGPAHLGSGLMLGGRLSSGGLCVTPPPPTANARVYVPGTRFLCRSGVYKRALRSKPRAPPPFSAARGGLGTSQAAELGQEEGPPTPPHSTSSPSVRRKDAVGVAAASSPGAAGTQALGVCGVQAGSS